MVSELQMQKYEHNTDAGPWCGPVISVSRNCFHCSTVLFTLSFGLAHLKQTVSVPGTRRPSSCWTITLLIVMAELFTSPQQLRCTAAPEYRIMIKNSFGTGTIQPDVRKLLSGFYVDIDHEGKTACSFAHCIHDQVVYLWINQSKFQKSLAVLVWILLTAFSFVYVLWVSAAWAAEHRWISDRCRGLFIALSLGCWRCSCVHASGTPFTRRWAASRGRRKELVSPWQQGDVIRAGELWLTDRSGACVKKQPSPRVTFLFISPHTVHLMKLLFLLRLCEQEC